MKKILIVDDEPLIVKGLQFALEQDGYAVEAAYDGEEALNMFRNDIFDMILLDVMLPTVDGIKVCQEIRSESDVPIIMLTAKSDDIDKIIGLEYGADDYITKPFNILEVKARIKTILRRTGSNATPEGSQLITVKDIVINTAKRNATIRGKDINLTAKEFDILKLLVSNPGKVYTRESLLSTIWGYDYLGNLRTVDVHIRRLREKVEIDPALPEYIYTKWGVGYYFADN